MDDSFNSSDRQTLIELRVEQRYTKEAIESLRKESKEELASIRKEAEQRASAFETDRNNIWEAIEELRRFRWWLAGAMAAGCGMAALIAKAWH